MTLEKFRYVKLNLTAGKTNYGYQVKEFAVIGKNVVTIKKLESRKKYFIKVRTYTKVKGKKVYGKWSKRISVKVK